MIRSEVGVVMGMVGRLESDVMVGTQVEVEDGSQHSCQTDQHLHFLPENEPEKKGESIAQAQEEIGGPDSDTKRNITPRLNLGLI